MEWWGWVMGGAILLGAELVFVDAQFYLVFIGCAALATGLLAIALPGLPEAAQWAVFAILAVIAMSGFRARVYARLKVRTPGVQSGPAGGVLTLPETLAPGESCQAEHGGTWWSVRNESGTPIASGTRVHIVSVEGLTLSVRPVAGNH